MEIDTSFVDINNIKSKAMNDKLNSYENIRNIKDDEKMRQVSDDFESFFVQQILKTSLKDSSIAGEGSGSDIIKSMYIESISQQSKGTLGISDMLYDFLSKNNK